jgi:ribA/ribD-fused uncharacterized protein
MAVRGNFFFFWSGPFSQWAIRPIMIEGVKYNCNEQYMMAEKARLFKDDFCLREIMKATDPAHQKAWGRKVQNFEKTAWDSIAREVVYRANYAKFTQHPEMKKLLMDTGDLVIVEASPVDKIWGIGLRETSPRAMDPKQWNGTNWLGEAIMRVRDDIRREDADQH